MTLTNEEILEYIKGKKHCENGFYGESEALRIQKTNDKFFVTYKGGVLTGELQRFMPPVADPLRSFNAAPDIKTLEENYQGMVTTHPVAKGMYVSEDVFKQRLSICRGCQEWIEDPDHPKGFCDKDTKPFRLTWATREKCPSSKWRS